MLIVLHSAPSQHPWHKLCFLTGLFLFCRAPPYLSTCILCTQTHSLRPLQVPDTLLDLMHSPPSTRLPSPSLSSPGLFCFRLEPSLQNNVHCQRDVGGERRASRCVFVAQIQPAAPFSRRRALRLDKNLWLLGDNRFRSSLSTSRRSLRGLFRSVFVNVVWLHPTGHFITNPI